MSTPAKAGRRRIISGLVGAPLLLGGIMSACENPLNSAEAPTPTPPSRSPTPVLSPGDIEALLGSDYLDTELGFFISYPSHWNVDAVEAEGLAIAFKAPVADVDSTGRAYTSITVVTYVPDNFPRATTRLFLEVTLENGVPLLEASMPAFELLATDIQTIPAGDAALFEFRHGADSGRLHTMQLVIAGTNRVYAVTLTALDTVFESYLSIYLAVVFTFTILGGR